MSKKKQPKVIHQGNNSIVHMPDNSVYAFHIGASTSGDWLEVLNDVGNNTVGWESQPITVQGKKIVPYGINNQLPTEIRQIMDENNLAPGILEREIGLLWGQGPQLFKTVYKDGDISREWVDNKPIWNWLNSWDLFKYLTGAIAEYKYLKGHFTKIILNKGYRIGRPKINSLEFVPGVDARLEWVDTRKLEDVKHIFVGDWENDCQKGLRVYPVFNKFKPFDKAVSIAYYNSYSFARNFYPVPSYFGTLNWIQRSSDIPQIIKYLTDNSLNVGYIVTSPKEYWEEIRDNIIEKYVSKANDEKFIDEKFQEIKTNTFKKLAEVMSGKKNVGKFFETVSFTDSHGKEQSWKIEPIDHKTKDFVESQISISKKADSATTSGMGLHPSLSNIIVDGKLASGSEMLYALKLYLASDVTIPETVIMQGINDAIAANFPGTDLKLGFYHKIVLREEDVSPQDRTTKNI